MNTTQKQFSTRSLMAPKNGLKLFAWAAALFGTLSISNLPGDWGHSVCGVWGCGPPTQALVGCHLAWFVVLIPLAIFGSRSYRKTIGPTQQLGKLLCITGTMLLMAVVVYQWATWLPAVSEWHREFFWQRCGFVIATSIDIPMLQILAIGLVMVRRGRHSSSSQEKNVFSPKTEEVRL